MAKAKYCQMDCTKGSNGKGEQYVSDLAPLGSVQPPEHLHRVCPACGYEWLELCLDAPGQGDDQRCSFCCVSRADLAKSGSGEQLILGVAGAACHFCIKRLHETLNQLPAGPTASASRH